jgi:hypothetical protein
VQAQSGISAQGGTRITTAIVAALSAGAVGGLTETSKTAISDSYLAPDLIPEDLLRQGAHCWEKARLLHRGRAFVLVLTLRLLVFQKVFWIN